MPGDGAGRAGGWLAKATREKLRADVRLKLATVASIDLNADLGEGFGAQVSYRDIDVKAFR